VAPESRKREQQERQREIQTRIERLKDRLRDSRKMSEEKRQQTELERGVIREELIRVVATHGDSMTHVKDNEYINLILEENCEPYAWNRSTDSQTILSFKKSDIRAFRSGQLTLEQLKSRLMEYQY
jgi:hypothetical protein